MPRRITNPPTTKSRKKSNDEKLSLVSFVVHSFNRLRGKPNTDYQNALYKKQHTEARKPWQAVAIVSESRSCVVSRALKGKRFLCDEAPTLPLPGCTAAECNCRYKHFPDRRSGPRRADEQGVHVHMSINLPHERRTQRGRRRDDR